MIAESAAPNKGVFGTTLSGRMRLPRRYTFAAGRLISGTFSSTARTDELGLTDLPKIGARDKKSSTLRTRKTNLTSS
jgi:hypothetical protein